ncbi:MAG: ATP-binding cassette domain-containing protein [Verrucomicrobia bacterium]|nr:ATP-binding cassette domain-containing protein [Verrucomicrobiota bacterium]
MLSTAFIILEVVFGIGILYLLKMLVEVLTTKLGEGAAGVENLGEVWLYVGLTGLASVLFLAARQIGNWAREAQGLHVSDYMNRLIHTRAVAADLAFFESSEYFNTLHRARQKGTNRPALVVTHLLMLVKSAIMLVAVVALIFTISPWLVPILLLVVLPPLGARLFFTRRLYEWEKRRTELERRAGYLDWLITFYLHAKELRLNRLGNYLRDRFSGFRETIRNERLGITRQRTVMEIATGLIGTLGFFGCLAFLARETAYGRNSLGDLVLFLLVFQRAQTAGQDLVQQISSIYEDHLYLNLIFQFLEVEPRIQSPKQPVKLNEQWQQGLRFENVSFQYPGTDSGVLEKVNLEVRPNQVVAIVGSNGSGKTTLIKLMCRLYDPTEGQILLEGTDIRDFDLDEYRQQFGVIFQDFTRYYDSVRENIRFGDIGLAPDSTLVPDAARRAGADKMIDALPLNYDTLLGRMFEGGHEISVGQWQKLALARAFVNRSRLMILDEPTSALDPNAEFELFESFRERLAGRSAIVISHRLSTIRLADYIYVIENGKVVEQGQHQDLMREKGYYHQAFNRQGKHYQEARHSVLQP